MNWPLIGQPHSDVSTHYISQTTSTRGTIILQLITACLPLWLHQAFLYLPHSTLYFLFYSSGQSRCPLESGSAIGFPPRGYFPWSLPHLCLLWGPSWFPSDCTKCFEIRLVVIFHCTDKSWLQVLWGPLRHLDFAGKGYINSVNLLSITLAISMSKFL